MPLYTKERTRAGDLVGGTVVVKIPRAVRLRDETRTASSALAFTRDQLAVYGEHELETLAAKPEFVPITLNMTASLEATTRETTIRSHNLIGKLPGRRPDAGAVLFVAHWDHFGECGEPTAEDTICNGAVDNASGLAALTEVARRLARGSRPSVQPRRRSRLARRSFVTLATGVPDRVCFEAVCLAAHERPGAASLAGSDLFHAAP